MWIQLLYSFTLAAAVFASSAVAAAEVGVVHRGIGLRAVYERAAAQPGGRPLVLLVHGTMSHYDMTTVRELRRALLERGYDVLAPNLSLGVDRREGPYDCSRPYTQRADEVLDEIGAWLDWAHAQGARRVVLAGHSRGGQQAAWFAAARRHPALERIVLLAPALSADAIAGYAARFGRPLEPLLEQARRLVAAGRGGELLREVGFFSCERAAVSAEAFLSFYARTSESELPATLPAIRVPTLVVVAGRDEVVPELAQRIAPAVGARHTLFTVAGADHFFGGLYVEDAADAITAFLGR